MRFTPLPDDYLSTPDVAERAVLERWESERTFAAVQAERGGAEPFVFWEGPPTANGRPGIHHVLARTLKDAVCRYQTMLGRRVDRKAGWDTHGLPVEIEVEKRLGISGKPAIEGLPLDPATGLSGVARFNDECRKSVWTYREEWEKLSARIGYWLDYEHPYVTYEREYVDSVWYLLARMHRAGLVYRGRRVLPFCSRCGTGLSSHELGQPGVYREVVDPSVTVRFVLKETRLPRGAQRGYPESLLAWTTTPWTLPSNFAVAVHPDILYDAWQIPIRDGEQEIHGSAHQVVWIANDRAKAVLQDAGYSSSRFGPNEDPARRPVSFLSIHTARGRDLLGARYEPLFDARPPFAAPGAWEPDPTRIHQVVAGDFVTVEDGTGLVHQAPYGADDWETAKAHGMPLPEAVGREGRFVCDVGPVKTGTFFKDADAALVGDLKARGLLFHQAREAHSYPHCWRCDTPLFYFPAPAWYLATSRYKDRMLALNRRVRWVPVEVGEKRFGEWLENNVDWNISRDRYWGTPLPFWVCDGCGREQALESLAEVNRLGRQLAADGTLSAATLALDDPHKPAIDAAGLVCPDCSATMRRTPAVLDCWFDSGAMPFGQFGWPHVPGSREQVRAQFPADYICEGLDQTRGWFYTLHAIGSFVSALEDQGLRGDDPPYRSCLVNGLVLDKQGVKMSKRLGNVIDPWALIDRHGADAVRWYLIAGAAPWLPKRIDAAAVLEARRRFFSTLANSYQFFREYARIDAFDPLSPAIPAAAEWPEIDRWLHSRTHSVAAEVRQRFEVYDLTAAARAIETFVVDDLSNWYIRRNRRRFWKGETGPDKLAAFAALHGALRTSALLIAPLAPFLSEMLWQRLEPGAGSVHGVLHPQPDLARIDRDLEDTMTMVQELVVMGRSLRETAGLKVRQPLRAMHVRSSDPRALRLLQGAFASSQVLDELNVKALGSLGADDGALCRLTAKANFKLLGKRLGARMKAAAAAIAALSGEQLAQLRSGSSVTIQVDAEPVELAPEEILIQVESQAAFPVETDGRFVVWLDTALDDGLIAEGLAREVVTRVNSLRREAGLAVEERVRASFSSSDPVLARSLERHRALIASEILAEGIEFRSDAAEAGKTLASATWDLGSGRSLACALFRA